MMGQKTPASTGAGASSIFSDIFKKFQQEDPEQRLKREKEAEEKKIEKERIEGERARFGGGGGVTVTTPADKRSLLG